MILTVTPNLALDVTYEVDTVVPGESHRVLAVRSRAGGKGVNVARTLRSLGDDVLVTGFVGGATGTEIRADLVAAELDHDLVRCAGVNRRTLTLVAVGVATVFNEPGPLISADEWAALESVINPSSAARPGSASVPGFGASRAAPDAVVIAGSLPAGAEPATYGRLAKAAAGVPVIVDTSGPALLTAAPHASIVKPNAAELAEATRCSRPVDGARELRAAGAGAVVVSLGQDGLLAVTDEGVWQAEAPQVTPVNPTGAGDAVVAALARSVGEPWPDRLRVAVALSAATVLTPVAGSYEAAAYRRFRTTVEVRAV